MLRINRSRFIALFCLITFIYFLAFTESGTSSSEFRLNTEAGLARKQQRERELPLRGHLSDEDLTRKTNEELQGILSGRSKDRLVKDADGNPVGRESRQTEQNAVLEQNARVEDTTKEDPLLDTKTKEPKKVNHNAEDLSANGRKAVQKPKYPKDKATEKALKDDAEDNETEDGSDPGKDFAREKLMEYLKHPVVIFSKSYCPHSKRAKHLLLDIYKIEPRPLVVELDQLTEHIPASRRLSSDDSDHETLSKTTLGKALQDLLAEITGRRTVPNIVVGGGHSIGGNDNIWELHNAGTLTEEIKKFGGRKIVSVDLHDSEDEGAR